MAAKTTEDLREVLFKTIDLLKKNQISPENAKEVSQLADRIIDSAKLEMEYARTVEKLENGSPKPLQLTHDKENEK